MILGIDPGLALLGAAVLDERRCVAVRTLKTKAGGRHADRIAALMRQVRSLFDEFEITAVGIEDQHGAQVGATKAGATNANAARVREVVGSIREMALARGIPYDEPTPAFARRCAGLSLDTPDRDIKRLVRVRWGIEVVFSEHAANAVLVAEATRRRARFGRR